MKTPLVQFGKWTLFAGGLILSVGCTEELLTAQVPLVRDEAVLPALFAQADTPDETKPTPPPAAPPTEESKAAQAPGAKTATAESVAPTNAPASDNTNAPAPVAVQVVQGPMLPPNLQLSPPLMDIVKLVQAGVNEEVIFTYISNSTNVFNMGSDEIVYLSDLGVSSAVLTALIQHDTSPETLLRKQASVAVQPLPPGVALNTPAKNIYPSHTVLPPDTNSPSSEPLDDQGAVPDAVSPTVVPADPAYANGEGATQQVSVAYFQSALAPYGTWINVPDYGLCWRPTVAVVDYTWRPYANHGRWLWTDAGWYWYSHYSWGWAPFHYGRWCDYPKVGWVWVPGTVWAPSWVTWRYNNYYCGWAPLPPRCSYVSGGKEENM
jgi:hypothetical protein